MKVRGKKSTTLVMVSIALLALTGKFLLGGLEVPILGLMPAITAGEFGLAATGLIGVWQGREYIEKVKVNG